MPYLVDGHNLIGAVDHMSLSDPEDELALVQLLQGFCARTRKRAVVYFDGGMTGTRSTYRQGLVTAHFVLPPRTADDALKSHLLKLAGEARNWTVVSSDHDIRSAAQHAGARSLQSEAFAQELQIHPPSSPASEKPADEMSAEDLRYWEDFFKPRDEFN